MKKNYRGFRIEVTREKSITGYKLIFYSAFRISDRWCLSEGSRDSNQTVREMMNETKETVDEYIKNPKEFEGN